MAHKTNYQHSDLGSPRSKLFADKVMFGFDISFYNVQIHHICFEVQLKSTTYFICTHFKLDNALARQKSVG